MVSGGYSGRRDQLLTQCTESPSSLSQSSLDFMLEVATRNGQRQADMMEARASNSQSCSKDTPFETCDSDRSHRNALCPCAASSGRIIGKAAYDDFGDTASLFADQEGNEDAEQPLLQQNKFKARLSPNSTSLAAVCKEPSLVLNRWTTQNIDSSASFENVKLASKYQGLLFKIKKASRIKAVYFLFKSFCFPSDIMSKTTNTTSVERGGSTLRIYTTRFYYSNFATILYGVALLLNSFILIRGFVSNKFDGLTVFGEYVSTLMLIFEVLMRFQIQGLEFFDHVQGWFDFFVMLACISLLFMSGNALNLNDDAKAAPLEEIDDSLQLSLSSFTLCVQLFRILSFFLRQKRSTALEEHVDFSSIRVNAHSGR
ncbi:hypothetical protein IE077_003264 [Cardiosporidium cionae]|uniref:Ion transport domain-containing protein n=1 Tax=Cardiosporidium cionae TaxID=476202 RepID=A0ABQ7J8Q6_9APIC|nr:hypothetical protein IE077_003264 [Cardiosporidium cionae]|eukprot:KAF8820362.1 hypothetical protein IE077_003264 [Cardiosporidium cionae]